MCYDGAFLPADEADRLLNIFAPRKALDGGSVATASASASAPAPPIPLPATSPATPAAAHDGNAACIEWAFHPRVNHGTAIYGDAGVAYASATTAGYASSVVHGWTPELLTLRDRVEQWHVERTGRPVRFNVCLMNRLDFLSATLMSFLHSIASAVHALHFTALHYTTLHTRTHMYTYTYLY